MSPKFDNTNRGALFTNDRRGSDAHADYTGSLNVCGREYWISAWRKTSKSGGAFLSLSVTPKDSPRKRPMQRQLADTPVPPQAPQPAPPALQSGPDPDDPIPF